MRQSLLLVGGVALVGSSILVGRLAAVAAPADPRGGARDRGGVAGIGPDVIVGALPAVQKFGTVGDITAYSIATTSCNIGDQVLLWCDTNVAGLCSNNDHPVIAQNMYRLKDGRFEMIGMSWLKHGFCALSQTLCGPCQSTNCDTLGIGCSDPYSTSLNGSQSNLGPRSQVNASTGFFPYPFSAPPAQATIGRRLQIHNDDVNPALNPDALYFAEGHYIAADDHAAGNGANNAAYRRATIGSFSSGGWNIGLTGPTVQQLPAIYAWQHHGLGVNSPDPDVYIELVDVPDDGRFLVGYKVSDNGDGTWNYEFAVQNLFSDRSAGSFHIPVPSSVNVLATGQSIINHHSGEPYSTAPWTIEVDSSGITWSTETFDENANANALRWGTLFNFRFVADSAPEAGLATLGLFKPGAQADPLVDVLVPSGPECDLADLDCDGVVDGADLGILLNLWGSDDELADLNGDGVVDGADLGILLNAWG